MNFATFSALFVIPKNAGIQILFYFANLDPRFRGNDS